MQVVVRSVDGQRDLDVELRNPQATLGDLARAAGAELGDGPVVVSGRRLPASCPLAQAGLVAGGLVELDAGGAFVPRPPAPAYDVIVTAGLDAGGRWPLTGTVLVGRGAAADVHLTDPAVSRAHCTLALSGDPLVGRRLHVSDVGARNAIIVGEQVLRRGQSVAADPGCAVRLGPVDLQVRARDDSDRPLGWTCGGRSDQPGRWRSTGRHDRPRRLPSRRSPRPSNPPSAGPSRSALPPWSGRWCSRLCW